MPNGNNDSQSGYADYSGRRDPGIMDEERVEAQNPNIERYPTVHRDYVAPLVQHGALPGPQAGRGRGPTDPRFQEHLEDPAQPGIRENYPGDPRRQETGALAQRMRQRAQSRGPSDPNEPTYEQRMEALRIEAQAQEAERRRRGGR